MWLGKGCIYKLNINGEEKVFQSEQDLDAFLNSNTDNFKIDKIDRTLSVDMQAGAIAKLNEAKIAVENVQVEVFRDDSDPEISETIYKVPNSMGVTKYISTHGLAGDWSQPICPPFDLNGWKNKQKLELMRVGKTADEAEALLTELSEELWPELTDFGTDIHKIYECVFSDKEIPKLKYLSSEQIQNITVQAQALKSTFKAKYGENAKFLTEFAIKSKELAPEIQVLLEKAGINSLNGKVDLIIVDQSGDIHLFDYKVSKKNFGTREDWIIESNREREKHQLVHSTKKRSATNQLAAYNAILRQYGLMAKSCNIIPIKLDVQWDNVDKSRIRKIKQADGTETFDFTATQAPIIYNVPGTKNGRDYNNWISMVPAKIESSSEESIKTVEKMNEIFPNSDLRSNVQRREASVEYFRKHPEVIQLKKLTPDSPLYNEKNGGYRYSFKTNGLPNRRWVNVRSEEELQQALEKYVEDLNNIRTNELRVFADNIRDVFKEELNWENIADSFPAENRAFITHELKRYFDEGWDFIQDDNLNSLGFFIFRRNGVSEILMLTNQQLLQTLNLGMGTSLLGKKVANANVNSKEIFDANYGNIEIMKAMYYISEHSDMFKQFRIAEIRAINPWSDHNRMVSMLNSSAIHNWNMIVMQNPELDLKQVNDDLFWDDVTGLLSIAYSKMETLDTGWIDFQLVPNAQSAGYNEQWISDKIKELKSKHPELHNEEMFSETSPVWQAYLYLTKALLALKGLYTVNEMSPGEIFANSNINLSGLQISAGQYSPSANIRILAQVHDQYVAEVRNKVQIMGQKFQGLVRAYIDEEQAKNPHLVNDKLFESWFRTLPNGEINPKFLIKNPYSAEFNAQPKAKAAIIEFINVMAKLRGFTDEAIQEMWDNDDETLFEIPLTEARFGQQARRLSVKQAFKNKWKEYQTLHEGVFAEDEDKKGISKVVQRVKANSVYNKFRLDSDTRAQKLKDHGVGFFSMDVEEVFNQALTAYVKEDLSKKYVPTFQAMRLSLQHAQQYGKQKNEAILETFDKFLDSKFYGEPIMKEDLRAVWRYLNLLKKGFSMMTLGLNFNSMFRELLQGTFIGFTRSGVKLIDGLDAKHYIAGAGHVIKEAHKNFSSVSLLQQLNTQYGMANMSLSNLARQRKINRFGIRNWSTDTLFWTSSAPDFQHRMSILVGKMMQDGSWEAHSLDKDGVLKYDWKKDKRFEAYVNNKTDDPAYFEQRALYLNYIREYNRIGYTKEDGTQYQEGDDLPIAYPPREQQTFKNFADLLYGHYDDESRALINDTFIGSFFLQYKTFITAKLEQWVMKPGIYNTELLKQQYDPVTKEKLYIKVDYKDGNNIGIPTRTIIRESQLTEEDKKSGNYEPYMRWEGAPMEGMWQSTMSFAKAIRNMDGQELREIIKDPMKKANLILALNDMVLASIIMLIINALFSTAIGQENILSKSKTRQEIRDENWWTQWSYKVAMGAFQDGPFTQIVMDMFSDVNPPLISSMKKLVDTSIGLITGDMTLARAVTSNIGAVREFQGMVRTWEN